MNILIAEDDLTTRTMLTAILKRWGFEVTAAADGETAWRLLRESDAPRVALLDWEMPGLDGVEICRRVRARETDGTVYTSSTQAVTSDSGKQTNLHENIFTYKKEAQVRPVGQTMLHGSPTVVP